jgi:hypothetical protein
MRKTKENRGRGGKGRERSLLVKIDFQSTFSREISGGANNMIQEEVEKRGRRRTKREVTERSFRGGCSHRGA